MLFELFQKVCEKTCDFISLIGDRNPLAPCTQPNRIFLRCYLQDNGLAGWRCIDRVLARAAVSYKGA